MNYCRKFALVGVCALVAASGEAANCGVETLSNEGKFEYTYQPRYFETSKNYELNKPFAFKPGSQLVYRKVGKRDIYLVADSDVSYKSGWFLAIKFNLIAAHRYRAFTNTYGASDLRVIKKSGGKENTQLLYVNKEGNLCDRVGSYSEPARGFSAVTTLVQGTYVAEPDVRLAQEEVVDPNFFKADSITLEESGPALWRLTANHFFNDKLVSTKIKDLDRNAEILVFEGYTFNITKTANGSYEATVRDEPPTGHLVM